MSHPIARLEPGAVLVIFLVVVSGSARTQQTPGYVTDAIRLSRAGDNEAAVLQLHRAFLTAPAIEFSIPRETVLEQVKKLGRRLDRLHDTWRRTVTRIEDDCERVADAYARRKWYQPASEFLASVDGLGSARLGQRRVAELAKAGGPRPKVDERPVDSLVRFFDGADQRYDGRGWRSEPGYLESPPPSEFAYAAQLTAKRKLPSEERVSLEYRMAGGFGEFMLLVGYTDRSRPWMAIGVRHQRTYVEIWLDKYEWRDGSFWTSSSGRPDAHMHRYVEVADTRRDDWLRLSVEWSKTNLAARIGDGPDVNWPEHGLDLAGKLAIYFDTGVHADDRLRFRKLAIGKPTAKADASAPTPSPEQRITKQLAAAERELDADRHEAAAHILRELRGLPAQIADAKLRTRLAKQIADRTADADPVHSLRERVCDRASKALVKLAKKYEARQWYRVAVRLMRHAALFERDPVAQRRRQDEVARLLALCPRAARAPKDILSWFPLGDVIPQGGHWKRKDDAIQSPKAGASPTMLVAPGPIHAKARLSFEYRTAAERGDAGFVFGFHNPDDYFVFRASHAPGFNRMSVAKARSELRLTEVWHKDFERAAARIEKDKWVPVTLDFDGPQLRIKLGELATTGVRLDHTPVGCIGLYLSADKSGHSRTWFRNVQLERR